MEKATYVFQKNASLAVWSIRSNRPELLYKKGVLRNFAKFTGKHLYQSLFFKKESLAQVDSCEFYGISKNTFFKEHLWTTVSKLLRFSLLKQ